MATTQEQLTMQKEYPTIIDPDPLHQKLTLTINAYKM